MEKMKIGIAPDGDDQVTTEMIKFMNKFSQPPEISFQVKYMNVFN